MSEGDSVGESVHGKPSVVYRFFTRLGQVGSSVVGAEIKQAAWGSCRASVLAAHAPRKRGGPAPSPPAQLCCQPLLSSVPL